MLLPAYIGALVDHAFEHAALPLKGKNSGFRESRYDWEEAAIGVFPCISHEQASNKQMFLTVRCL
ncbi:hypothetical protein [Bradyrhizobium sp. 195]|uniref:hypothetical protein n=1 Tax=Bradyrhizobium sp. 195 TaxID=2782662 RepID=UPI002000E0AE|nr:hypothetical protein [Bradyrhizobium sp. 195]UPK28118.1 hypothetical protein IVB26_06005 [Bradyrhizobium sp. 195]